VTELYFAQTLGVNSGSRGPGVAVSRAADPRRALLALGRLGSPNIDVDDGIIAFAINLTMWSVERRLRAGTS
jgi:hypothetical protein